MDEKLLELAVKEHPEHLQEVLNASYSLKKPDKLELMTIANETNKKLGFKLFNDLYYPRLIHDFSLVSRVVAKHSMKN